MPSNNRPAQPIVSAAEGAHSRLSAILKTQKGEDARRLRRAINSILNMIDRFAAGDITKRQEIPPSVQRNPTTDIERKVMAFWRATDLLQDRMFDGRSPVSEETIIATFHAIS